MERRMPHKDPAAGKAYHRAWRQAHAEELKEKRSAYYQAHKEQRREYTKQWVARNPKRQSDRMYRNRVASPWANLIRMAKRRGEEKGVPFSLTQDWGKEALTGRCALTDMEFDKTKRSSGPK